ncbi:MAG: Cysteine desulfurase [Parcubacteria group bacterium ADurb.Bin305]|nr:MAG: Cysteine desulfurase [Parcubacteria group bacterium ADurb.Bin305]
MSKHKKTIYLDYAATTPVDKRVLQAMQPYFNQKFGNTMSLYSLGREAKYALEKSRKTIANLLHAKTDEIIFTGSATESVNWALKGVAFKNKSKGNHLIISAIEHSCVRNTAQWLQSQGFEVTEIKPNRLGILNPKDIAKAIRKNTILVSIIHGQNEIGTLQPIGAIGKICREKKIYFHTDVSQTFGKIPINVSKMNIDLLTASSHKIYGPKGAACLFIREGVAIEPYLHGGGQEHNLRPSTVNVPAIVGFAKAAELCQKEMATESLRLINLRDKLIKGILVSIKGSHLTGHPRKRLANNVNFWFDFVEGEAIVMKLDLLGICASTGSACSSQDLTPSYVLLSLGLPAYKAQGSLRLTLGRGTTEQDIDYTLQVLPQVIHDLRLISPFKKNYE